MRSLLILILAAPLCACSYPITDIDISGKDQLCARECTHAYSQCMQGGPAVGSNFETQRACRDAYSVCISTCPTAPH